MLTYRDGQLFKAVTRGNGEIGGSDYREMPSVVRPSSFHMPFKRENWCFAEKLVITYEDFRKINEQIEGCRCQIQKSRNL